MHELIWRDFLHLRFSVRSNLIWPGIFFRDPFEIVPHFFREFAAAINRYVTFSPASYRCEWHDLLRGGAAESLLLSSLPSSFPVSFAFAGRHTACGYTERMGKKERFKISDGRFGTVISQHEARARRQHDLGWSCVHFSVNPVGYRLAGITKDLGDEPPRRGTTGKSDADAFRKAGPPVGEKARIYRSRFPETWGAVFSGDLRQACFITKRTQRIDGYFAVALTYILWQSLG